MRIKILLVVLIIPAFLQAQNEYYDALYLKDHVKPTGNKLEIKPNSDAQKIKDRDVLRKYVTSDDDLDNLDQVFADNPFIGYAGHGRMAGVLQDVFTNQTLSSIGGIDVTNLADGIAKFLVERVKEELTISFFTAFKEDLKNQPDLKTLFPATWACLNAIDTQVYGFSSYVTLLRESFLKDFQTIIPHLEKVINDPSHDKFFNDNKPIRSLFLNALVITKGLQAGKHAGDILNDISTSAYFDDFKETEPNLKPSLQTLNLLVQSLRSKSADHYLVPMDSITSSLFSNNALAFKIYLGLVYQKASESIYFNNDSQQTLRSNLAALKDDFDKLKAKYFPVIEDLVWKSENVQQSIQNVKQKNQKPETKADYADYFQVYDATLNLLESASSVPDLLTSVVKWKKQKDTYFFVARKLGEIYLDVNQKKYASAILSAAIVYDTILSATPKDNSTMAMALIKYGNFAAQIAGAENSDQVKAAIEAVALPAGSSRVKRESSFNVSLNAFVGPFVGAELSTPSINNWKVNTSGITAPVGVSVSFGGRNAIPIVGAFMSGGHASQGLFFSIIDVGTITSFRFSNDSTKRLSKIEFKDIFSPGIFYSYGIPRWPISINMGYQVTPYLTSVNSSGNTFSPSYSRYSISFVVDIPVINFYTKPRKKS